MWVAFGATLEVTSWFGVRADLGVGGLFLSDISMSPFTGGAPTTGTLSMLHLRAGLSADFAFTPNLIGTLTPLAAHRQGIPNDAP